MKTIFLKIIRLYQKTKFFYHPILKALWLSDASCRFSPTCSNYCYQAIEKYGIIGGIFRCLKRISKCHPFSKGGIDPLPKFKI